jgi:hypothetical protein
VDLFGAAGSGMSKDKDFKHNRKEHLGPLTFTDNMVNNMFKALDLDGDTFISKRDLELWLRNQKVGKPEGFAGYLEFDEIDAFLHGGRAPMNHDRSMTVQRTGILHGGNQSGNSLRKTSQNSVLHPSNSLAGMLDRSFHTKSSNRLIGDLNETATPLQLGEVLLSREDLGKCLARLAFLFFLHVYVYCDNTHLYRTV